MSIEQAYIDNIVILLCTYCQYYPYMLAIHMTIYTDNIDHIITHILSLLSLWMHIVNIDRRKNLTIYIDNNIDNIDNMDINIVNIVPYIYCQYIDNTYCQY